MCLGLDDVIHPERSNRKKCHDFSSYEQEIRNKLSNLSPICSTSANLTTKASTSFITINSPSDSYTSDYSSSSANQSRPPLSAITPTKNNLSTESSEKTKPRPLNKRIGFKRAIMQKFKITKHNK